MTVFSFYSIIVTLKSILNDMAEEIVNRVKKSGIVTIDFEDLYPKNNRVAFDIEPLLWQGLALKEKDFREYVAAHDWSQYKNSYVAIFCSVDAIVPTWAYMLLATHLEPYADLVVFGSQELLESKVFDKVVEEIDLEEIKDRRVVVKGCSKLPVPVSAYVDLSIKIKPVVKALMFGEPCSTVPIYRKPRD